MACFGLSVIGPTSARSILSRAGLRLSRPMIEACPVPKSSISTSIPSAPRAEMVSAISSSGSSRKMDSSNSNERTPGAICRSRRSAIRPGSRRRGDDMLTEILGMAKPDCRQD
ncbi:hypothetical protein D9M70_646700 [compost metagenome]